MRQLLQHLSDGRTELVTVPMPAPRTGCLPIRTAMTLISAGTEKMLIDFGRGSWVAKARQQPDKVRQVLDKVRTDGLAPTLDAVRAKLDAPIPLGYCNVGRAMADGGGFRKGERVVSNGPHAEFVNVPYNLCAKVPDAVSDEAAAFTVVGAVALHGLRLVSPDMGERFVVIGLGLIGLLEVMLLRANGCRVLGVDFNPGRCKLARSLGAETVCPPRGGDPLVAAAVFSRGLGVDGVLVTAATSSNEPIQQAAEMCRKRGRIVLVGVTGLKLSRDLFYRKELSFQVSCSYGPGRYDPAYEEGGADYPPAYVRWTEQRNFQAFLDLLEQGRLDVSPLISHRFALDKAQDAYAMIAEAREPYMGVLLEYGQEATTERIVALDHGHSEAEDGPAGSGGRLGPVVGFIGAGAYTGRVLLPAMRQAGVALHTICSTTGASCAHLGRKFGFRNCATDAEAVLGTPGIDTVVVTTRHDSHARYVTRALRAGKAVFVEKPLCLTLEELEDIRAARAESGRPVMVGFNRRFSPLARRMRELLAPLGGPLSMVMTVNAGAVPGDHWTQDPAVGGGRVIGEACHFVDLLRFLCGAAVVEGRAVFMDSPMRDTAAMTFRFADGSVGVVNYLANGHKAVPKERLEVHCRGRALLMDNFRRLTGHGFKERARMRLMRQDKGQSAMARDFARAMAGGEEPPIPFDEIAEVSEIVIRLAHSESWGASG